MRGEARPPRPSEAGAGEELEGVAPGFGRVARREWARMRSRPLYPLLMLALPLAGWLVLFGLFGQRVPRELPVAVLDEDGSALARQLVQAIEAAPSMRVAERPADLADARDLLQRGRVYGVVVLPSGLERGALRGAAPPVVAFTNAQWMLPANLIARDLRAVVGTASLQLDFRSRLARGEGAERARASVEPVRVELRPLFNPGMDYAAFLFTALIPTLLQVFVIVAAVHAAGSELKHGTAGQWLHAAGGSVPVALLGKMAPYTAWYVLFGGALSTLSYAWLEVPIAGSRLLLSAGMLLLVLACQAVALLLVAWTANLRLATSLASFVAGPAFAFSGITFPLLAMPLAARAWAYLLPLTHFLRLQTQQATMGAPGAASLASLAALLAFVLAVPPLFLHRFGRVLRSPLFWGRA